MDKKSWRNFAIADFNLHKAIIQFSDHRRLQNVETQYIKSLRVANS